MRVQRIHSLPSALRSPLTRGPLDAVDSFAHYFPHIAAETTSATTAILRSFSIGSCPPFELAHLRAV